MKRITSGIGFLYPMQIGETITKIAVEIRNPNSLTKIRKAMKRPISIKTFLEKTGFPFGFSVSFWELSSFASRLLIIYATRHIIVIPDVSLGKTSSPSEKEKDPIKKKMETIRMNKMHPNSIGLSNLFIIFFIFKQMLSGSKAGKL